MQLIIIQPSILYSGFDCPVQQNWLAIILNPVYGLGTVRIGTAL